MSESTGSGGLVVALIVGGIVVAAAGGNASSGDADSQPAPNGTPVVDYELNQTDTADDLVVIDVHSSRNPQDGLRHYAYCGYSVGGDEVEEVEIKESLAYGELVEGDPCPQQ